MKDNFISCLLLIAAVLLFSVVRRADAAVITIPTADLTARGWYDDTGFHSSTTDYADNYYVGLEDEEHRNFFIFVLPALAPGESIVSANLVLYCPAAEPGVGGARGYTSPDETETYQLYALESTSIGALRAGGEDLTDIFADLGGGTAYSSGIVLSAASQGTDVSIPLSGAFLSYAEANLGGEVALGGAITSLSSPPYGYDEGAFGMTGVVAGVGLNQTRLVITTVPEPSVTLLLVAGVVLIPGRLRSRSIAG